MTLSRSWTHVRLAFTESVFVPVLRPAVGHLAIAETPEEAQQVRRAAVKHHLRIDLEASQVCGETDFGERCI